MDLFGVISNIIWNTLGDFMWKWRWKFGSKNVEFLTNRMFASAMIRVFLSLEHSTDCVRKSADNFRTFVRVPYWHLWIKHNRAKPMFESASAIFSIADAGEFRFARFYIVCEEVPLGTPESPPIVSGMRTCTRGVLQTWKDTDHRRCRHPVG